MLNLRKKNLKSFIYRINFEKENFCLTSNLFIVVKQKSIDLFKFPPKFPQVKTQKYIFLILYTLKSIINLIKTAHLSIKTIYIMYLRLRNKKSAIDKFLSFNWRKNFVEITYPRHTRKNTYPPLKIIYDLLIRNREKIWSYRFEPWESVNKIISSSISTLTPWRQRNVENHLSLR